MRRTGIERRGRTETEAGMKKNVPALRRTRTKNGTESESGSGSESESGSGNGNEKERENETGTVSGSATATASPIAIKETPKSVRRFDCFSYWRVEAGDEWQ